MSLALIQPQLNASIFQNFTHVNAIPSRYPTPIAPDTYGCAEYYAQPDPPTPEDCQTALDLLPSGTAGQPFSYHFNHDDPNRLPITVAHGTCEIIFETSGESAAELDPIIINPTDIRNMAGWVIDQCVTGERIGGGVTKNLKHATDWVLDPTADFEQTMPASTTYLSLYVWNHLSSQPLWNAGNEDPEIGQELALYIYNAVQQMPSGDDKDKLHERADQLLDWTAKQEFDKHVVWWQPYIPPHLANS